MARLIGIAVGLVFTIVVLFAFVTGAWTAATEGTGEETAESRYHLSPMDLQLSSDGLFGRWDYQQLQRGYQVYKETCAACHSLRLVAFRNLAELGYTEAEVRAEAANWIVPGIDPDTGENTTRPGLPTDYFPLSYANDVAAAAANNNSIPPDLSLMTKARPNGSAYLYSLLIGYREQPAELVEEFPEAATGPGLYYNPYFPNLNLAMPPPLIADGQVTYADGTEATIPQMSADVSAFLTWTAEPTLVKRKQTGWPVIGFLLFATVLAWLAKKQIWSQTSRTRRAGSETPEA